MNGDRSDARRALDDAIKDLMRFHSEGDASGLSAAEYHARAISIQDYVMRMANPDPVDPAGGASGGAKTKCPHCGKDIVVNVTK